MDCGPAALHAVALGLGRDIGIETLRERCHTDVDGTSIDDLERLAAEIGLLAEQRLLAPDMLFADPELLPALAVTRLASGEPHFVVIWRRHGNMLEIMDPASGRHRLGIAEFTERLWRHEARVPVAAWSDHVAGPEYRRPLSRRLRALGFSARQADHMLAAAADADGWQRLADLDAVARAVADLADRGVIDRPRDARVLLDRLVASAGPLPDLEPHRSVRGTDDPSEVLLVGAVILSFAGTAGVGAGGRARRAAASPSRSPLGLAATLLSVEGRPAMVLLATATAAATVVGFSELLLFRVVVDLGTLLAPGQQQALGLLALLVLMGGGFVIRRGIAAESLRLGRHLEIALRSALLDRLPRIPDAYFETRSTADLAERAHAVQLIRMAPGHLLHLLQACLEPIGLVLCLALLDPLVLIPGLAGLLVSLLVSVASYRRLGELEQRQRSVTAGLSGALLEALSGLLPIRLHGAERATLRRFESRLSGWAANARALSRLGRLLGLGADMAMLLVVGAILLLHFRVAAGGATDLLFVYWALRLPSSAGTLAGLAAGLAAQRNAIDRLLEPLAAATEAVAPAPTRPGPARLAITGDLERSGTRVLADLDLEVRPGQHVAVVGRSGAGKSSLIGLFLGLGTSSSGGVTIDGQTWSPERQLALSRDTAWIDPAVQLFDLTLRDNLALSMPPGLDPAIPSFLDRLLDSLPRQELTRLGEAGLLLSGGEGQRVRLARAMNHVGTRLALCDEPFRGLDRDERRLLMTTIRRHWRATTLVCATHDIADTLDFDRVLVLEDGRIVEDGAPAALLAGPSRYAGLLEAERAAQAEIWGGAGWRRLRLGEGRLHEHA